MMPYFSCGGGWSVGLLVLMGLGMVACLAVIAALVWLLVRRVDRSDRSSRRLTADAPASFGEAPGEGTALETLRARYARGEIDTATYDAMRARLQPPREQS